MKSPSDFRHALVVGAGLGLGAALARLFSSQGLQVSLAAREIGKLDALCGATGARAFQCDAADPRSVASMFDRVETDSGPVDVCVYNAGARLRGALVDLDPEAVAGSIAVTAYGGFLVGRRAACTMLNEGGGVILFTGASASVKGFPESAPFAMGKFALRGLAQSMARELAPRNIHVAHVVIDGGIRSARRPAQAGQPDALLDPDEIALNYWNLACQQRSAWAAELELRPWVEKF